VTSPCETQAAPPRGRRLVVLCMLAALATTILVGFSLRMTFARYYFLSELRKSPELLEEWLIEDELSQAQGEALTRFLDEPAGQQALFTLYVGEYDRCRYNTMTIAPRLKRLMPADADGGVMTLSENRYSFSVSRGRRGVRSHSMMNVPTSLRLRIAILERMGGCLGKQFQVSEFPKLQFELAPVLDGLAAPPSWDADGDLRPKRVSDPNCRYVCYFRLYPPIPIR